MKLFRVTKSKLTKDKNGENVANLEIIEVVLVYYDILNNDYKHDSYIDLCTWFMYRFVPNKSLGQLLDIPPKTFVFIRTFNSEFSYFELWFTYQNSKPLVVEDKININQSAKHKKWLAIQFNQDTECLLLKA